MVECRATGCESENWIREGCRREGAGCGLRMKGDAGLMMCEFWRESQRDGFYGDDDGDGGERKYHRALRVEETENENGRSRTVMFRGAESGA